MAKASRPIAGTPYSAVKPNNLFVVLPENEGKLFCYCSVGAQVLAVGLPINVVRAHHVPFVFVREAAWRNVAKHR